jgi:hypothetical protein
MSAETPGARAHAAGEGRRIAAAARRSGASAMPRVRLVPRVRAAMPLAFALVAALTPRAAVAAPQILRGVVTTTQAAAGTHVDPLVDVHVCRKPGGLHIPEITRTSTGGLADVAVWLERPGAALPSRPADAARASPGAGSRPAGPSTRGARAPSAVLDQVGCQFVPPVLVLPRGGALLLRNSDAVFHNAHVFTADGRSIVSVSTPLRGQEVELARLDAVGHYVVRCDAGHHWMRADVFVVPSGPATVTDATGRFELRGVAEGEVDVVVAHPRLGTRKTRVFVTNSLETLTIKL